MRWMIGCLCVACSWSPACASSDMAARDFVGQWYNETQFNGGTALVIEDLHSDGSFTLHFRECFLTGTTRDRVNSGHWKLSRDRMLRITEQLGTKPVHLTGEYEILSIDKHTLEQRIVGGDALKIFGPKSSREVRVTPDSKVPDCVGTS